MCGELLACCENTSTIARLSAIALRIDDAQFDPGRMSRGAIQHRTPADSKAAQIASAAALSSVE